MGTFAEKVDLEGFSISGIDTSEIDKVDRWLPIGRAIDLNVAEQGLIWTLHAQNVCQEQIAKIDRLLGILEARKSKTYARAALVKTELPENKPLCKTAKAKEWFAQQDEEYIKVLNEIALVKAGKRWFENKASYFSSWHYAFKSFLRRDYGLERIANLPENGYNITSAPVQNQRDPEDMAGEIEWAGNNNQTE